MHKLLMVFLPLNYLVIISVVIIITGAITLVSDEGTMQRCILFHDKEEV